jgi:hypothetical protein
LLITGSIVQQSQVARTRCRYAVRLVHQGFQYAVLRNQFRTLEPLTADDGVIGSNEHHCIMEFLNTLHLVQSAMQAIRIRAYFVLHYVTMYGLLRLLAHRHQAHCLHSSPIRILRVK